MVASAVEQGHLIQVPLRALLVARADRSHEDADVRAGDVLFRDSSALERLIRAFQQLPLLRIYAMLVGGAMQQKIGGRS